MPLALQPDEFFQALKASHHALKEAEEETNELNLVLTMETVINEAQKAPKEMKALCEAVTYGALMGARGNSGVILSQILRGICEVLAEVPEVTSVDLVKSLRKAVKVAYQAIRKPVEGTMLTAIKAAARAGEKARSQQVEGVLEKVLEGAKEALAKTPDQLPILKEAGVVDAGGFGLVVMFEGMLDFLKGEELHKRELVEAFVTSPLIAEETSLYQYCTEFMLRGENLNQAQLEKELDGLGDSLVVAGDSAQMRVHIHTNQPDQALAIGLKAGELAQVTINNMWEQIEQRTKALSTNNVAVVAVAAGNGLQQIFKSLGAEVVLNGGQSMNPSAQEIVKAFDQTSASKIIFLPNNKNIILAGEQAEKLSKKEVHLLPTTSIPQGLTALVSFRPQAKLEENLKEMEEAVSRVKSGEITQAVRDSQVNGQSVKKGQYLGLIEGQVKVVGDKLERVFLKTLEAAIDEESCLITFFFNRSLTEKKAQSLKSQVEKKFPSCEVEARAGGQPFYPIIFSVEE